MTNDDEEPTGLIVPVLRSFDEGLAKAFYIDWLGGEVLFEHRMAPDAPLYIGVRRFGADLHLTEYAGDATPGARIRLRVPDIDAVLSDLQSRSSRFQRPDDARDQP